MGILNLNQTSPNPQIQAMKDFERCHYVNSKGEGHLRDEFFILPRVGRRIAILVPMNTTSEERDLIFHCDNILNTRSSLISTIYVAFASWYYF